MWTRFSIYLEFMGSAEIIADIAVGGGPSGPSIEGPFCRAVHLCRALGDIRIKKKSKKITKKEGKIEKRRERNE